ncbi:1-acyl-sn-glycerol-3-phosphate acyltransferase [Actinocrinis puniceicyclus]|uniref:1-acyl-sn-glycerol-3-phosphate acyltransferase n=1 Tax=Actinocrinis puniceicyclus TaxID=977794 RepID=A0A8J7WMT3_9ACTN|nr:lysophospholipid acyltransferase family protein [Actinocrinis puniceicyclus]MBS2965236.1 1-acyl-sn-glycerol-3-phosphate acyltransferase [Actinocrinis puniceicyclus]
MARASRRNPRPGAAFTFIEAICRPLLVVLVKRDWRGMQNVPREGGVIVVANHYSFFDPISLGHFLVKAKRTPRFLAKAGVFKAPMLGRLFRSAGQIPVYRESRDAALAFKDALAAVERGETIIVYPEGTMTKDPGLWPMAGKTGAARIAMRTGAPVLPIAQWGAQEVFASYSKKPDFLPRKTLKVTAGEPIDLRARYGPEMTSEALRAATEHLMDVITGMLAEIRGEQPPAVRFDPEAAAPQQAPVPAQPEPVQAEQAHAEPAQPEPVQPEPVQAESAHAEPAPPGPAQPAATEPGAQA